MLFCPVFLCSLVVIVVVTFVPKRAPCTAISSVVKATRMNASGKQATKKPITVVWSSPNTMQAVFENTAL